MVEHKKKRNRYGGHLAHCGSPRRRRWGREVERGEDRGNEGGEKGGMNLLSLYKETLKAVRYTRAGLSEENW